MEKRAVRCGQVMVVSRFCSHTADEGIVRSLYSRTSPGWHWRALQIASNVDSRIAFALPFFKMEILAIVMPTFSASSVTLIFRLASITSMLMMIGMLISVIPLSRSRTSDLPRSARFFQILLRRWRRLQRRRSVEAPS